MTRQRMVAASVAALTLSCVALQELRAEIPQAHRVRAVVLSAEGSVRTSLNNHDAYLIRILPQHGQPFLARMIDDFPSYVDPLPADLLRSGATISVELRRASFCDDRPNSSVLSARMTATGEVEQKSSMAEESDLTVVRCFAVVHGSWKGNGALNKDEWWK